MCLRNADLAVEATSPCYLNHPKRDDDIDDLLLDVANQLELSRKDLIRWVKSPRSWKFMYELSEVEIDMLDFEREFNPLLCA